MTIQSAIYLSGNKRRLFRDIKPHLEGKKVLVDLFTGSGTVALNAVNGGLFEKVIANDCQKQLYDLHTALQKESFLGAVAFTNDCYPDSKEAYLKLREDYNATHRLDLLLNLNYRSNSNMMRWNKSGDFNMPFGERQRYDEARLVQHHKLCKDIEFHNNSFEDVINCLWENPFNMEDCTVYMDPPYLNTLATYNENGGWTETQEVLLRNLAIELQQWGAKVVISNVFENRGWKNDSLIRWCKLHSNRFDVYHLNIDYSNSSFRKSKHKTDEVLIVSK